ncbi:DUF4190 domain-containing protein [Actinomadura sp. KC06]|uniref:DUF4190 domain-containing protein n=1 Tax=Actinomadura sp. KC06 TaxID=2530369 RepID=UPI00140491E3|nr:DUF4190 domain-containing protein [Actinomadura sp. KC06]
MPGPPGFEPPSYEGKTNGAAIAAFVTGLLGCFGVLGIIFGIVALKQIGERGGKGRGLAIAGIILSCLWIVAGVAGFLLRGSDSGSSTSDDPGGGRPTTAVTKPEKVDALKMKLGDCINDDSGATTTATAEPVEVETVKVVPCSGPHDGEVLAVFKLPGDMLPSENQLRRLAEEGCDKRITSKIRRDPAGASLATSYYYPTLESWTSGDRNVTCVAVSATEGKKLTRPIRG